MSNVVLDASAILAVLNGMCGLILGCTVTQEYLTLATDGQFVLSRSTTTTMGDPGMGPFTAAGNFSPPQAKKCAVAAIDGDHTSTFLAAFAGANPQPLSIARVDGVNFSSGKPVAIVLYRLPAS